MCSFKLQHLRNPLRTLQVRLLGTNNAQEWDSGKCCYHGRCTVSPNGRNIPRSRQMLSMMQSRNSHMNIHFDERGYTVLYDLETNLLVIYCSERYTV